jgi:hypothetical protein
VDDAVLVGVCEAEQHLTRDLDRAPHRKRTRGDQLVGLGAPKSG